MNLDEKLSVVISTFIEIAPHRREAYKSQMVLPMSVLVSLTLGAGNTSTGVTLCFVIEHVIWYFLLKMLKWTVSRSLSASSSTPHASAPALSEPARRPFRDLSNTPPAVGILGRHANSSNLQNASIKPTPVRRRRCRSHASDLRTYFQATKTNVRTGKRQSLSQRLERSPKLENFYQGTPRVDADIEPLTFFPNGLKRSTALTLPTDPTLFLKSRSNKRSFGINQSNTELPQNVVNEARVNLQSHVSDFFHQISMATSPEDVMEVESVPLDKSRTYTQNNNFRMKLGESNRKKGHFQSKLSKITKINARNRTPYYKKVVEAGSPLKQTPLAGKLSNLALDQDLPKFENMDNTVTEVLNREKETNFGGKTVAEILFNDIEERKKILEIHGTIPTTTEDETFSLEEDHTYETIVECRGEDENIKDENIKDERRTESDSSVSSASQLLEDPSPISWSFTSPTPSNEFEGEFTLKRQRGIRRKRQQRRKEKTVFEGKRPKRTVDPTSKQVSPKIENDDTPRIEAINPNVKKLTLETDLDSIFEDKQQVEGFSNVFPNIVEPDDRKKAGSYSGNNVKGNVWELESPKSALTEDNRSSKSILKPTSDNTPEVPLVATVRRCLKYSPESEPSKSDIDRRGSIEIEYSFVADHIRVRVIRCKDLRRTYEGPIHAYVKVSLKNINGEGVVKRTAVHRATPNPAFHETLLLPCPVNQFISKSTSLDIAVWHRDRRARRSELLGCMTLPLPLSQDKEATWHPLESGSSRNTSTPYAGVPQECGVTPPLSKDGESDNNNSGNDDLTYLRHLELEPVDPLTGLPLHPGFTAKGGRTPCTVTRRLIRQSAVNQVPWGFSLSWGRPPRVERVDSASPAERSGLKPGDYVVFVETVNVVTKPRDEILSLIQAATNQLVLEVYRKGGIHSSQHRPSSMNVTLQQTVVGPPSQHAVAFNAEVGTGVLV
ncbi:hypothetical protein M0804_004871 [Polistes exclamans]|nr:hypothetical protein M0804_004871 [Polistes exclamans]